MRLIRKNVQSIDIINILEIQQLWNINYILRTHETAILQKAAVIHGSFVDQLFNK